jgi:hypothetical protein
VSDPVRFYQERAKNASQKQDTAATFGSFRAGRLQRVQFDCGSDHQPGHGALASGLPGSAMGIEDIAADDENRNRVVV